MAEKAKIIGEVEGGFHQAVTTAGMAADYVLVGDTAHQSPAVRNALDSTDMMRTLAETGATQLCLEVEIKYQALADQYQNGEISAEEFAAKIGEDLVLFNQGDVTKDDYINSIIKTMDNASQFGMRVHFVDPGFHPEKSPEDEALVEKIISTYEQHTGENIDRKDLHQSQNAVSAAAQQGLIAEEDLEALAAASQRIVAYRLNDEQLHQNIVAASGGEKTAIIYGAGHDDLATRLGDNTLVVDVYRDTEYFHNLDFSVAGKMTPEGQPDLVYDVERDRIFATDYASSLQTQDLSIDESSTMSLMEAKMERMGAEQSIAPTITFASPDP